ncbi:unnamed protein product, partial [marine sediment metagenome]
GENDTHVVDVSSGGNNGTVGGGNVTTADGKYGRAMMFDGTNDKITVPNDLSLDFSGAFSIGVWIKTTDDGAVYGIVSKGYVGGYSYGLEKKGTPDTIRLILYQSDGNYYQYADASTVINDGLWHHVVGTWDGSAVKIYIDGEDDEATGLGPTGSWYTSSGANLLIGWRDDEPAVKVLVSV